MARFPIPAAASREINSYTELREQTYRDPSLWSVHAELQRQIYRYRYLWRRDVISHCPRSSAFTHIKKLAAIIALLGFVFWAWSSVSTNRAPRPSYPYYDTQKPVPPWSEPGPLEGNYNR